MDDKELLGLLFSAIHHHNDSLLDDLLGADNAADLLDVPADDGNTLLHVAVRENDLNCLTSLLKHGANPNVFDASRARTPLHLAVELSQTEAVKTFLNLQHVDLELRDDRNLTCYEIAQFCDNPNLAELILNRKEEFEGFQDEFYTVMNQACTSNEPRLVRELFERYERKIINNLPPGWQPYKDKRQYSRSMLKRLINWSSSSWNDVTLLFKSASKGHTDICKLLIDFGATAKCNENTNYSPLYVAAYGGHAKTVRLLLDSFPSLIQELTIEKWTVLHACCLQGHSETAKLILNYDYPETLKRRFVSRSGLYEYNFAFNLNAQDAAGQTVIYLAVSANDEALLDTLLAFNVEAKLISNSPLQGQADLANQLNQGGRDKVTRLSSAGPSNNPQQQVQQAARVISERPRQRTEADRTSRVYPNQIDKIMRQLRRLQFSRDTTNETTKDRVCVRDNDQEENNYLICPFEMDTYCDYNSKTALHLAVCQQYHNIATTLLVNGSNPNLPILFRDPIKTDSTSSSSNSSSNGLSGFVNVSNTSGGGSGGSAVASPGGDIGLNWLRSSKSTCLKEACRLNDERMCEILIRYGARDNQDNLALQVAAANKNSNLVSMFLSLKSNVDPEFKINRKCNVEFASRYKQSQKLSKSGHGSATTTFSSMFPSTPVTIDWQSLKCIQQLDPQWLIDASLAHNKRLRHPTNSLMAITRLDLSSNNMISVHPVIFRLPSLRELNLSSNRLESLLDLKTQRRLSRDRESFTPTSKLIESQRTAMKRSKSSNFTGQASLESSNVIDLNEPQDWDLPHLEVLDLHDNLLISLPDCLFELPKLSELDVSANQLRQLPWAMWTAPSLRELVAAGNLLEDLPKAPPQTGPSSEYSSGLSTISDAASEQDTGSSAAGANRNLSSNRSFERLDASSFLSSVESAESDRDSAHIKTLRDAKQLGETTLEAAKIDLKHLNHWSKRIELISETNWRVRNSLDSTSEGHGQGGAPLSKLTYLNLSQNSFTSIPSVLACLATELTRLNMSFNHLNSLGDISLYPYKLKNLDLSSNQLSSWFRLSQQDDDTKHCYAENLGRKFAGASAMLQLQRTHASLHCLHKFHQRLDNLRSLNLSHNQLKDIQLTSGQAWQTSAATPSAHQVRGTHSASPSNRFARQANLLYPNITALDVSFNRIQRVPESLSEFKDLSVLNLSGNTSLASLPPELGLATKLWNLGVNGCNLSEPLKSIVESKTYKTMDIIGYLRSILEEAKPYARMKLMLVGLQGIGKTSLLEQMRQEGSSGFRRRVPEHWTKRMGHTSRSNLKNQKGVTLSTVGVDIHDWVYQKKTPRNQHNFGPVSFSTWDFGGQEEFYATHRYFLSRRSIYLVVWRLTDGLNGIFGIQQWLVNIQSRAPNSPVIIVGTHEDLIEGGERSERVQRLQAEVHRRFIDVSDHDKCGLPRIMSSIVVSTRTKLNVKHLCDRIYDVVFSLRCPGSTERLLEQKIPATYLYLEEIVSSIVHERHQKKREPVLSYEEYRRLTSEQLKLKHNKTFRDLEPLDSREINYNSELQQATRFLHENGVLLHYEDSNLRDLYFLDPQWLCDILSHVVTIREINPHVKNGLMNIDDLGHLFRSMDINLGVGVQSYVVNLLNKFEVALTWNSQYLLIPSLLPSQPDSFSEERASLRVKLAPRMRGRSVARRQELNRAQANRSASIDPIKKRRQLQERERASSLKNFYEIEYRPEEALSRLVLLRYLPAGYLARLQSAILSDPAFDDACEDLHFELTRAAAGDEQEASEIANLIGSRPGWSCWKRGIKLSLQKESTINTRSGQEDQLDLELMTIQELSPESREILVNKIDFKVECSPLNEEEDEDAIGAKASNSAPPRSQWVDFDMSQYLNIIEISVPNARLKVTRKEDRSVRCFQLDQMVMARLLSKAVDYIDNLLEDWYPSLGARFAHTLGGNYLVTRIVPCSQCSNLKLIHQALGRFSVTTTAHRGRQLKSMGHEGSRDIKFSMSSAREQSDSQQHHQMNRTSDNVVYCYYVEHSILNAYDLAPLQTRNPARLSISQLSPNNSRKKLAAKVRSLQCPRHGAIQVSSMAPDIVFNDVPEALKIDNDQIERCKLIGRGALGFVFKGSLHSTYPLNQLGQGNQEVALKLLQPVDPGPEADQTDLAAFKSAKTNWMREPFQCACKSYCTARHEVNILLTISHPNIVAFVGICLRPLAIVLELAPLGSLADVFKNYKRACSRIEPFTVQRAILQVAKALEFLHQQRVIYRDLKSENILVWSFPSPFATAHQSGQVELKLADYGISRQALATGIWKGFAGTMSYLAPEILRHNGDEEYTEKVDCFSFGMFMFELLTLRPPHNKQNEGGFGAAGGNFGAAASRSQFSANENGRPTLQKRDLIYPNYMLDLMSLCWSQEPHDRPTASQIVSIASAPEFMQVHAAVQLDSAPSLAGGPSFAGAIEYASSLELYFGGAGEASNTCTMNVLAAGHQDQWLNGERFELKEAGRAQVTSMVLVDQHIWFCDSRGPNIHVISAHARALARETAQPLADGTFSSSLLSDHLGAAEEEDEDGPSEFQVSSFVLRDRHGKVANVGKITTMVHVEQSKCVILLTQEGLLWICKMATMICERLEDGAIKYNCIALASSGNGGSLPNSPSPANGIGADSSQASSLDSQAAPYFQLYCGQSNGISCLEISEGQVRKQSILPLAGNGAHGVEQEDSLDASDLLNASAEISHIVVGAENDFLWTAAKCTIHLWSVKGKHVIRKLDCWKLVPCSESLESINIEQYYQQAKTSEVTSLVQLGEQLFVGTTHGCLMVIEASSLKPMTVFRPYESQLLVLHPFVFNWRHHHHQQQQRAGSQTSHQARHLVALGRGYRDLMRRYLPTATGGGDEQQPSRVQQNKLVAILLAASSQYDL